MSENILQVYEGNPQVTPNPSDLVYAGLSPYNTSDDTAGLRQDIWQFMFPCRVASSANLNVTYSNGTAGVGATLTNAGSQAALLIDSITVALNDRVLVAGQLTAYENGIYVVTNTGSGATNWVLTRAIDWNNVAQMRPGRAVPIMDGTLLGSSVYVLVNPAPATIGSSSIIFNSMLELSSGQLGNYLPLTGGTLTGNLILSGNATTNFEAVTLQQLNAVAAGIIVEPACYAATTANLNATYVNGSSGVGATLTNAGSDAAFSIDGVSPPANSIVLIKNQSTTYQNGFYTVTTAGTGLIPWVLTRASFYDTAAEIIPGTLAIINNGTANANTSWIQTQTVVTIGTDAILFTQFTANPATFLKVANNLDDVASAQTSINNISPLAHLGDILVYNGTNNTNFAVGSNGQILQGNSGASDGLSWSTPTYPSASGSAGQILRANGTNNIYSTSTFADTYSASTLLYSNGANTVTGLATANNGVLITSNSGVPSISSTLPAAVQANITATGTIATGVWQGTAIALAYGGTNADLTASAGSIAYSTASAMAFTAAGTSGQLLASAGTGEPVWTTNTFPSTDSKGDILYASAANTIGGLAIGSTGNILTVASGLPAWTTATYPSTTTINQILYSSSANTVAGITTADNGVLITGTTGTPSVLANSGTAGYVLTANSGAPPSWQAVSASGAVETVDGDSGSATPSGGTITISGGSTGLTTSGSGSTLDLTGILALASGGTNHALTASAGGIVWSDASKLNILAGTATASQILLSGNAATPAWSTSTYPATNAANTLLYASSANTMAALATANSSVLTTSSGGVPTWASELSLALGGTNANLTASNGGIVYSTASALAILSGTATASLPLLSQNATSPVWGSYALSLGGALTTAGALTLAGAYGATFTFTNTTSVTFPTSGTLATTAQIPSFPVSLANGGTGNDLTANNGGIFYSTASAGAILSGTATATQMLQSGASTTPAWSTTTWPATSTANQILYSSANNTVAGLATADSGVLVTSSSGVPSILAAGTAGALLQAGTTNAWTTTTYPSTNAVNTLLYASSANVMGALATADNGVLITSASGVPSWLADGTTGQVLTATTGSPPAWGAAPASGAWVKISSQTASNSASITFSSLTSTYQAYCFVLVNVIPVTNNVELELTYNSISSNTYTTLGPCLVAGGGGNIEQTNIAYIPLSGKTATDGIANTANGGLSGTVWMFGPDTANNQFITAQTAYLANSVGLAYVSISAYNSGTTAITSIVFKMGSGNISSGTFELYGITA